MFEEMIGDIREDTVRYCYNVTVKTGTERRSVIGSGEARKEEFRDDAAAIARQANSGYADGGQMPQQAPKPQQPKKPETVRRQGPKVGRNEPCPCGSGKKYKNCCMSKDLAEQE